MSRMIENLCKVTAQRWGGEAVAFSGMCCLCCIRCLKGKLSVSPLNINSCQVMNSPSLFYNGTKIGICLGFLCNYPMRACECEGGRAELGLAGSAAVSAVSGGSSALTTPCSGVSGCLCSEQGALQIRGDSADAVSVLRR